MSLIRRTSRYLAQRFLADPQRRTQESARANAAHASAVLREQRSEREAVEAYVRSQRGDAS